MPGISTSSATTTFALSGISTIDPLLDETYIKWRNNSVYGVYLSYSFPWINGASADWQSNYSTTSEPQATQHFGLNATQQSAAKIALQTWATIANVTFSQVTETATNVGDIRFAFSSAVDGKWGWSYYPGSAAAAADVWINPTYATSTDWSAGSYNYDALLHEIGHGLGLKHPGNYNGSGGGNPPYLPADLDYRTYTIMSYNDLNPWFLDTAHNTYIEVVPETPMVYDIAAIQHLYGANNNYHTTNDTYTFQPSHPFYMAIWDAGGTDTIDVSNFSTNCTIDLTPGHYSSILYINQGTTSNIYTGTSNLGIAFGAIIENATGGTGNDTLIGNSANNLLNGGGGINTAVESGNYADYSITYNAANQQYTVTDQIANRDGIDTLANIKTIQFADATKPLSESVSLTVIVFSPADAATGVTLDSNIVLTFSDTIQKGVGWIQIHRGSSTGPVFASYDAATSSLLTITGNTLTINPATDLEPDTHYVVTFDSGSIKGTASNSFAGTSSYDFTTLSHVYTNSIQQLYVAYFGRPAEIAGLTQWQNYFLTHTAAEAGKQFAGSAEYKAQYTGMTNSEIINTIYNNLFHRNAEPLAQRDWSGLLEDGTYTIDNIVTNVADGALNSDKVSITDKVAAATAFTNALVTPAEQASYHGDAAVQAARAFITSVYDDASKALALTPSALAASVASLATATLNTPIPLSYALSWLAPAAEYLRVGNSSTPVEAMNTQEGASTTPSISNFIVENGHNTLILEAESPNTGYYAELVGVTGVTGFDTGSTVTSGGILIA